jgi:hypothetical protein
MPDLAEIANIWTTVPDVWSRYRRPGRLSQQVAASSRRWASHNVAAGLRVAVADHLGPTGHPAKIRISKCWMPMPTTTQVIAISRAGG